MNTFLRILFCIALLITGGLAAVQYLVLVPPGVIPQDWIIKAGIAAVLLGGIKEGIVAIGDIVDDGERNGSFSLDKLRNAPPKSNVGPRVMATLLFLGLVSFMLVSCVGDKFLGLDETGWRKVGEGTGRETLKLLPAVTWEQYQKAKAEPEAKQPSGIVNPAQP